MTIKQNSALENLEYIKQIMNDTRTAINDKGLTSIIWGIMVALGQVGNYILLKTNTNEFLVLWVSIVTIAWVSTIIESKIENRKPTATFASKIINALWLSFGVTITIVGFAGPFTRLISGFAINPLIATILGGTYFVAGLLYGKKWFQRLSYGWWSGAIIMFYLQNASTFLIFAVMMILFQAIPGIIFYRNYKASRDV